MKKIIMALAITTLVATPVLAAEYTVQPGDSIKEVSDFTGNKKSWLIAMNKDVDMNALQSGEKLRWISRVDLSYAKQYCIRHMYNTEYSGRERYKFAQCADDVHASAHPLSFAEDRSEANSTHFLDVFEYVKKEIATHDAQKARREARLKQNVAENKK